jgi:hypothetical protein
MNNLITSDNLTFTKKKCNCGLKSNNVDTKDTSDKKKISKKSKSKSKKKETQTKKRK